jgi:hypothetical protein
VHHYFWLADKSPGTALADFPEARFWTARRSAAREPDYFRSAVHADDVHTNRIPPSRFPFRQVRCEPNALGIMEFN